MAGKSDTRARFHGPILEHCGVEGSELQFDELILHLRFDNIQGRNWKNVEHILQRHYPELTDICRHAAFSAQHRYWARLRREFTDLRRTSDRNLRIEV